MTEVNSAKSFFMSVSGITHERVDGLLVGMGKQGVILWDVDIRSVFFTFLIALAFFCIVTQQRATLKRRYQIRHFIRYIQSPQPPQGDKQRP